MKRRKVMNQTLLSRLATGYPQDYLFVVNESEAVSEAS